MNDFVTVSTTEPVEAVAQAGGAKVSEVEESATAVPAEEAPEQAVEKPVASDTAEEDVESERDEDAEEQSKDAEQPRKKRGGFKRRIDKLNGRLTAVEQEKEYWREQALKAQNSKPPAQGGATSPTSPEGKPKVDSFDTHEEYVEALTDWKIDQRDKASQAKATETAAKSTFEAQVQSYQAKVKDFAKAHDDFDDVLESVGDIPMSIAVQQSLLESEIGPAIAYELAKDPDEYARICKLGLVSAAREVGRIEARLLAEKAKPQAETKTTKAPRPVAPVSVKSGATVTKDPDDMSFEEFKRWRQKSMKG